MFRDITAGRLLCRLEADKEKHPYVIYMSAPGTGKSRLADYGLEALKTTDATKYPNLASLANNGASLAVHVSYNNATPFSLFDVQVGPEASLAYRLLASYFRRNEGIPLVQMLIQSGVEMIRTLSVAASVQAILLHHRKSLGVSDNKDVLLYLAVDDVSGICSSLLIGWTLQDGKAFLKSIFDSISSLSSFPPCFVVSMVTGTVISPTREILTNRPVKNLAVPLLTLDQSVQLSEAR